jgi:hypothetical protein
MNTHKTRNSPRMTPWAPGERVANWVIVEYLPAPSGRLREGRYLAKPGCCGVPRVTRYTHLKNAHRHQSDLCRQCMNHQLAERRWEAVEANQASAKAPPSASRPAVDITPANWLLALRPPSFINRDLWGQPCLSW